MSPSPKHLILNLLRAADGASLTAADAVTSAALFGIRENSVRVTLVRLAASGLVQSAGRGSYELGSRAADLAEQVEQWRQAEERVVPWSGQWIMVSTGNLGRSDRTALRQRERALALLGFKALDSALYVRPDNLVGHAAETRERLHRLGLEADAPVFAASDLPSELDQRARQLWQSSALTQGYIQTRKKLEDWLARSDKLEPDVAARECYLLGNEAIRQLVFDPLLPEPLVDTQERRAFRETVASFDETGHRVWRQLLPSLNGA
ncbi:MAG: PaaX family transcriptional regulator C-terminal domain-containing protein [Aquabacterium sp.]|uniref:PaaX family transcriptional regulator C-terminal domain-containing protein n=1 Tax=Aquabacterium sp. TaxID=1872578 RepID=UPI003BE26330